MGRKVACLDLHFPDLDAHPDLTDMVSLALDDLAPAAIHETGDPAAPVWRVFLADPARIDKAAQTLRTGLASIPLRVDVVEVEDEDWAARSQAGLRRVRVGRITVAPPWDAVQESSGWLVIVNPSMGFGTGHHQTTRLCLRLLQTCEVTGRHVVDLGTGSGVLALAAWRLGAAPVEAIDDDRDAMANAAENLRLNSASDAITLRQADLRVDAIAPAEVVLANLTGAMLIAQAAAIAALVRPGGTLIISGILEFEVDAVAASFTSELTLVEEAAEDEWRALRFART